VNRVIVGLSLALLLLLPSWSSGQNLELNGGWIHATSDFGVDGLELGTAIWFNRRVSIAANYDTAWDTSNIGTFALTSVGLTTVKSHLQNFLVGPRIFFAQRKIKNRSLNPFGEVQLGMSHLNTKIEQVETGQVEASDNAFSWMIGGGADFQVSPHWAVRGQLGFLRTHFAESGQSRFRTVIGVAYTLGSRR
jgi:hypothetical protein